MNKKKLLTLAMALSMVAILAIGGTIAYFTDVDSKDNVFTVGKVSIDLKETFDVNAAKLMPVTYNEDGTRNPENVVEKKVTVANDTGSEDAYVRIQYAVPSLLVDPDGNANGDKLHVNFTMASVADGLWSWHPDNATGNGWVGNGTDKNQIYTTEIGGIGYTVWVVTYRTALAAGVETAEPAITQVYMDKSVTNDEINTWKETLGDNWHIYVVAEGVQADGFDDAYTALDTAFGVPGSYEVQWTAVDENSAT